jgi:NMD protein affecting ribosome stability and mRNA decay
MRATRTTVPARGKGRVRGLVRRGSRSDRSPKVAVRTKRVQDATMCERCGAVYRRKRWRSGTPEERIWPVGLAWAVCPACKQIETGEYFGRVLIPGGAAIEDQEAIRRRIENVGRRAQFTQPERRLISVELRGEDLEVLTTSQKLAHRVVRELVRAFGGDGSYSWSDRDGELLATWHWNRRLAAAKGTRR